MTAPATKGMAAGRIGAAAILILAIAYGLGGATITYAFASDPLGPRAFPVALAGALAVLGLLYWRRPGMAEAFPKRALLRRTLAVPGLIILSVLLLEPAGFAVSIFVLTAAVAWIFGASLWVSLISGAGQTLLWWFVFVKLLAVYLPAGRLFA